MSKKMEKATENSGFLDGRSYTAAFLYEFFALLVGNGVYANELAPTATNENMSITHGIGHAWINGVCYKNTTPFILDIAIADGSLNRYDSLMLRLDLSINEAYATIVQGDYATTPTPPTVTRNAETFDLKICDIYIPAGCTKITQAQIIDTRLDTSVCGVPVFPVEHLDTETFYRQISADLENFQKEEKADFAALIAQLREEIAAVKAGTAYVMKSGDTMTGNLTVPAPTESGHAVNKGYVDTQIVPATLSAASWAGDAAPYTQTITVAGLTDAKRAHAHPVYSGTLETDLAIKEACACVSYAKSSGAEVTFYCLEDKPEADIPIEVEVSV